MKTCDRWAGPVSTQYRQRHRGECCAAEYRPGEVPGGRESGYGQRVETFANNRRGQFSLSPERRRSDIPNDRPN